MYLWLDSLLWSISRAYRRRKIKRSRIYAKLLEPIPPIDRMLERQIERPAILVTKEKPLSRAEPWPIMTRYQREQLQEKLTDEAIIASIERGQYRQPDAWPQYRRGELASACAFCAEGEHGIPSSDACDCPCHRGGA